MDMSRQTLETAPSRKLLWSCAGLTALAAALVIARLVPVGVPGQWVMGYIADPSWSGLWLALGSLGLVLLLCGAVWAKLETARLYEEALALAMLVAFLFAMQFGIGALGQVGSQEAFIALTTRATTNLYFAESGTIDNAGDYLRGYNRHAAETKNGWQLKTHPPGPVMFFYAARCAVKACPLLKDAALGLANALIPNELYWRNVDSFRFLDATLDRDAEAAGWLAVAALRLAAALSVVPLYLLARALYGRRNALAAAALAGLVPSLLLFNVIIDQLYPLIALTAALIAYHAAKRRSLLLNILCGIVLYVGLLFSLSFLVIFITISAVQSMILLSDRKGLDLPRSLMMVLRMFECILIGVLGSFMLVEVTVGFQTFWSWVQCGIGNSKFNVAAGRTYWAWLLANPIVFAAFLGVPAAVLFARALGADAARLLKERRPAAADPFAVCSFAVIAALWLWGANLGEVERLWMPLMPLCVMAGVGRLALSRTALLALIGLQGIQAVVFKLTLDPLGFGQIIRNII